MKVYIATGFDNGHKAKELSELLKVAGVETTRAWWDIPLGMNADRSKRIEIAVGDAHGVKSADLLVALMKGATNDFDSIQLGTHVEIGIALGRGVPVILVNPDSRNGRFCIFHSHPGVIARLATTDMYAISKHVFLVLKGMRSVNGPFQWDSDR